MSPRCTRGVLPARCGRRCPGSAGPTVSPKLAAVTANSGRGALVVVPDQRDVDAVHAAAVGLVDESHVVALSAGLGPAQRYRRWLSVLRGGARIVIGTRSAVFAPVANLGLVMVWDDGDDTLAEPRAPYPHAREVAMLRAHQLRCASLIGGYARTAEAQALVRSGWAHDLVATRQEVRARSPRVVALEDSGFAQERDSASRTARLPSMALQAAGDGTGVRAARARSGAPPWLCARAGMQPLPHDRPLPALHRAVVAAGTGHRGRGVPVVRPRRTRTAVHPLRLRRRARRRRRSPSHRRGTGPGVSRRHRRDVGRRRDGRVGARGTRRRRVDTRCGTRRCRRLRSGDAPRHVGAARAPGPPGVRGRAAPLDGGRRAGPLPRRRRGGRCGRPSRRSPPCRR